MKKLIFSAALVSLLAVGDACKSKEKDNNSSTDGNYSNTSNSPAVNTTAPVEIAGDETLRQGVTDATKDVKGLTTRVENGVIYLSGTISRDDNMRITPTLNSLRPKSINRDNLTVK